MNDWIYEHLLHDDPRAAAEVRGNCSGEFLDDNMLRARERLAWLMELPTLLKESKNAVATYKDAVGWLEEVDSTLNLAGDSNIDFARIYLDLRTQVCGRRQRRP